MRGDRDRALKISEEERGMVCDHLEMVALTLERGLRSHHIQRARSVGEWIQTDRAANRITPVDDEPFPGINDATSYCVADLDPRAIEVRNLQPKVVMSKGERNGDGTGNGCGDTS
jgi:hypothetical protein